jgi:hypothetical protein
MSSCGVLRGGEQTRCLFIGLVAFVNAFVGMLGYRCLVDLPADASKALAGVMVLVGLFNVLDFLIRLQSWRSQDWVVDVVPYADIWNVQQDQATAQYLSYYGYTWMD